MQYSRGVVTLLLVLGLATAMYVGVRGIVSSAVADVKEVPSGSQEIAWIAPATSSDSWERLVAAVKFVQSQWTGAAVSRGKLEVSLDNAFLDLTAEVPEIALSPSKNARLLIRWYKLSGDNDARQWIAKLSKRAPAPLAIIGGDSSDRALTLARLLEEHRDQWVGAAPLFLITTATAERYFPGEVQAGDVDHATWPKLMSIYQGRSFRFAFTNTSMVKSVLDFVRENPYVCAAKNSEPQVLAGTVALGDAFGSLSMLHAAGYLQPFFLYTLAWWDDGYSKDLAETFLRVFSDEARGARDRPMANTYNDYVAYSTGEYNQPNPREEMAVGLYLANNARFRDQHQLLALPTAAQRARRFLRTLCRRAPTEVRNAVVLTGDAISFNNVYRDRNVAWNIQDMPVPLVFFSHRNPIDAAAGFGKTESGSAHGNATGTHDLLIHADILRAILLAVVDDAGGLNADTGAILNRLRLARWSTRHGAPSRDAEGLLFFDADGNRRPGTGEHVVWLKPTYDGNRSLPEAVITVWSLQQTRTGAAWRLSSEPLRVRYDRPNPEGNAIHAGN